MEPGNDPARRRRVFRSVPIRVHSSWLLLAGLLSALFAVLYFRGHPGIGTPAAVGLGVLTGVLFFGSIVVHELAHAVVALRSGLRVDAITLRVFGGVTQLEGDPKNPAVELRISLAGPIATFGLVLLFLAVGQLGGAAIPAPAVSAANNLALVNGLLLCLNLIPAVPLDGGRILRAVLWQCWGNPAAATRAVAASGRSFGLLLIGFGVLAVVSGGFGGTAQLAFGAWFVLVGIHLRRAAGKVTGHLWFAERLRGVTAGHLLDYRILSVQRTASGHELAALDTPHSEIPVLDEEKLIGAVRLEDLHERPVSEWGRVTAEHLMRTDIVKRTLGPGDAAIRLLPLLSGENRSVAVLDGRQLVGIVTMDTLRRRLALGGDG